MTDTQPPDQGTPSAEDSRSTPPRVVAAVSMSIGPVPPPVRSTPGDPPIFQQIAGPGGGGMTARAGKDFLLGDPSGTGPACEPPSTEAARLRLIPGRPNPDRTGVPLTEHVAEQLEEAGITSRDPMFAQQLVMTAAVFAAVPSTSSYSQEVAVDLLARLLRRQPLGPGPLRASEAAERAWDPDGWEENSRTRALRGRLESAERLLQVAHRGNGELTRLLAIAQKEHESQMRARSALLGMVVGLARAHGVTGWVDEQGVEHPMDEPVPAGQFAVGPKGQFIIGVDATLVGGDVDQAEQTPSGVEADV